MGDWVVVDAVENYWSESTWPKEISIHSTVCQYSKDIIIIILPTFSLIIDPRAHGDPVTTVIVIYLLQW